MQRKADAGRFQDEEPERETTEARTGYADERYEYAAERHNWPGNEDAWLESRMERLRRLR